MKNYITKIKINKLLQLNGLEIDLSDQKFPHLIITGCNGSGKTTLLNAIADFLEKTMNDKSLYFLKYRDWVDSAKSSLENCNKDSDRPSLQQTLRRREENVEDFFGKVELEMNFPDIIKQLQDSRFFVAFYPATRLTEMKEPTNPTKPNITNPKNVKVRSSLTSQFLYFLSDLKIQEALAVVAKKVKDADKIKEWFTCFEGLLRQIFVDETLTLEFNYQDYNFFIRSDNQRFKFTQLSDGYAAIIEIVADLILKMQGEGSLSSSYDKRGVVLIDEIETHLHLRLQKEILPFLTTIFPNIQFVVTTHSPFVLSSLPNAVAYDLEHKKVLSELTDYSFEALSEGYFGVLSQSSYIRTELGRFKDLVLKGSLSDNEKLELKEIKKNFDKISSSVLPALKGEYNDFYIENSEHIKEVLESL